ncbi:MAG: malate dehydrogenase [bacterium]
MPKVAVVGAGNVGAEAGREITQRRLADVTLIDIIADMPQGKALDILESAPISGSSAHITGSNDFSAVTGSEIVVITAGVARKPGMTRDDLIAINFKIVKDVCERIKTLAPDAIVIVVTNPLDAMVYTAQKITGFSAPRVMGMAGVLDAARLRAFITMELGVSAACVQAMVLGSHGDLMVPVARYASVSGIPLTDLLPAEKIHALTERTKGGGGEIVALLKTGSAYYAPGASIAEMVQSVLWDEKRLLPVCAYLNGEFGISGAYVGVPVILGRKGVEKIVQPRLLPEDLKALQTSAEHVKELMTVVDGLLGH